MSSALRVLVLGLNYAPEPTGIAPYTTATARFLAEAGHEVRVVTGLPHYPHWRVAEGYHGPRMRSVDGSIQVTRVWHPVPAVPSTRARVGAEMAFAMHAATITGPRPDVVLAVSPALLTVAAALRHRWVARGTKVGVVTQDLYGAAVAETGVLGARSTRTVERLERGLLRRCDGVVAIHDAFADSLVSLGVDRERITVIRNWTHVRPGTGDRARVRRSLGWRDDETIVLHAGNMGAKQGLENVVDAARLAGTAGLPVRFVLMGDGNRRRELMARDLGRHVEFRDPAPDDAFADVLRAADVLLLNERPGIAEMCVPSKLTSYFAAGRPVLAATGPRSAATREIVASGGGLCVAPAAPQALVDAAITLGMDPAAADVMGARGTLYATTVLTETTARDAYVDWVERMVGPALPTPRTPTDPATTPDASVLPPSSPVPGPRSSLLRPAWRRSRAKA